MPLAPAIAASLALGLTARARSLFVGGTDVTLKPGASGNDYGALVESVRITEGGPGTVSSMTFTVEDPKRELAFVEGQVIRLIKHSTGIPEFLGFIQAWTVRPSSVNRLIDVVAQGVEAILDWLIVPSLTIPAGTTVHAAAQVACANAVGTAGLPLRAFAGVGQSTQATPIDGSWSATNYAIVATNISLRQVLAQIGAAAIPDDPVFAGYFLEFTVDFYTGLRMWTSFNNIGGPADYSTVLTDGGASVKHADMRYTIDPGGAIHNVQVVGGNAAGTGLVTDGSGMPGRTGVLNDPTILTAAARNIAGRQYLQDLALAYRGTLRMEEPVFETVLDAGVNEVHAGGQLQLDDSVVGLAAFQLRITGLSKQILPSGRANWTFNFGGNPPRATDRIRRLTSDRFR